MMKRVVITVFIALIIVLLVCYIAVHMNISNLCGLINKGETQKAIAIIERTGNVNRYSAPKWMRKLYNIAEADIEIPLVTACRNGNGDVVSALLEKGADANKFLDGNWSPIEAAFVSRSENRLEIAKELVSHGANVELYGGRQSALFTELSNLIYSKTISDTDRALTAESVTWLLDNGALPSDDQRNTVIHYLAFAGEVTLLETLSAEYGDLLNAQNNKGETPLMWAVKGNSLEGAEFLLNSGVDVTKKDSSGMTAYDYSLAAENMLIAELLE